MTTWMDFEDIKLSEISQIENDKYCMISLTYRILKSKLGWGCVGRMGAGQVYKMGVDSQKVHSSSYKKISHGV